MPEAIYRSSTSNNLLSILFILFPNKNIFTSLKKNQNITLIMQRYKKNRYNISYYLIFLEILSSPLPHSNLQTTCKQENSHFHTSLLQSLQSLIITLTFSDQSKYLSLNQLIQKSLQTLFSQKRNLQCSTIAKRCFFL